MEQNENEVRELLSGFADKVLSAFETLNTAIAEIRRDIHIQTLTANTKIDTNNHKLDGLVKDMSSELKELTKSIQELKRNQR